MPDDTIRIGADDEGAEDIFGIGAAPVAADLHPFPLDARGQALEAARRARFPSAVVVTDVLDPSDERAAWSAPVEEAGAQEAGAPALEDERVETVPAVTAPRILYLPGGPGITVVPLQHPFLFDDREVREIAVPPPTCGLRADFAGGLVPDMLALIWHVTGEPVALIRALRAPDDAAVEAAVRAVLPEEIAAMLARAERIAELARLAGE